MLRALDDAQVRYAIAGGFAVVLHGVPRMTFDLDIIIDEDDENVQRLVGTIDDVPVPVVGRRCGAR